ncbi:MAG: DMT family transporter, partial [Promethearchaeota archaeon]
NRKGKNRNAIAYILLILTALIWGGTWPLGRWLVSPTVGGPTIPPLMIAFIRYFLAIICFFIILKVKEGAINYQLARKYWKLLLLMGITSVTIYQIGYLVGEFFTAASDASILWKKIIGTAISFISVVAVIGFSPNIDVLNRILGDILILIAALAYATYTVISRYFMNIVQLKENTREISSLWLITWVSFFGFLTTSPLALILSPEFINPIKFFMIPIRVWFGIFYLTFFSTIGAYTFYLEGVKRLNASRAAIFQTLVPFFGVLFSVIFLKEKFDILIYPLSLMLVIVGIILVNKDKD